MPEAIRNTAHQPDDGDDYYPGKRLGLPQYGARSVARPGRRLIAISIDWAIATVISLTFFSWDGFATLAIFAVLQIVFLATVQGSIGQLLMGLRIVSITGGWVGVLRPAIRTVLLSLVIPAVIWDRDQRGLHDRLSRTLLVRK